MKTVFLLATAFFSVSASAADVAAVTPYRPSVSSPAQLPAAGQLELELGGLASWQDQGRRASLPYTLKLAIDGEWALLLGGEGWLTAPTADGQRHGVGDTQLVLKRAMLLDEDTALGLELGTKLPSARKQLGSGRADYSVNGIVSRELGALHLDANLNLTRIGAIAADSGRTQLGLSAALSGALEEGWGLTGEWAGNQRRGAGRNSQLLLALSYSPSKLLTLDVGLAHGLNAATPRWSLFSGMVMPLARLW
jgi:hypothetical protein